MSNKTFGEMSDEEKQQVYDKWVTSGLELRLKRFTLKKKASKELKKNPSYRALLQEHRQVKADLREFEEKRTNLWSAILSIRAETYRKLINDKEKVE